MRFWRDFTVAILGTWLSAGCGKSGRTTAPPSPSQTASVPDKPLAKLPTVKLWLGSQEINAEVARTPIQLETGMMFRTNLAETEGMLFLLPYTQPASFWMKNCLVPLSVAYIDPEGILEEVHDLEPGNTDLVTSASANIRFALEVNRGWFARHQVSTGMVVRTERGSLTETFFGRR